MGNGATRETAASTAHRHPGREDADPASPPSAKVFACALDTSRPTAPAIFAGVQDVALAAPANGKMAAAGKPMVAAVVRNHARPSQHLTPSAGPANIKPKEGRRRTVFQQPPARFTTPPEGTERYLREVLIEVNFSFRLVPRPLTTAMIASEMPAAINPYSIAVAPDSSFRNFKIERFM